jgi:hypothetical protein
MRAGRRRPGAFLLCALFVGFTPRLDERQFDFGNHILLEAHLTADLQHD